MKLATMIILAVLMTILIGCAAWLYTPDKPRLALEAKYLNNPGDYRQIAGIRLHLRDSGPRNAPVVILLHGFGASLQTWDPWADSLSTDYRVIRFDLPGFGLTGPDPTGDYSVRRGSDILLALMDQLDVKQANIVGNSLGGKMAWNFAAQHPSRVSKLVLISPDGFASPGFEYGKPASVPLMARLLPYTLPTVLLRMSLAPAYSDPDKLTDATVVRYRDLMLAPGVRSAVLDRMAQVVLEDPAPLLKQIEAPTLLVWGENDAMIPFTNAADYLRDMPHATLVALPGLGHVPFEEEPAVTLEPVKRFLASGVPSISR